jgi:uncharacterized protein YkwD
VGARRLLEAMLLAFGVAMLPERPSPAPTAVPEDPVAEIRRAVNGERSRRGAAELHSDPILDRVAQERAEEIAGAGALSDIDDSPDAIGKRAAAAGYETREVSEIVLFGGDGFEERLRRFGESSPDIFADAMRPDYRSLGVGVAWSFDHVVRALVFGRSAKDEFEERTSDLENLESVRARMLDLVNAERRTRRLGPLVENALLDQAAQRHADDMIRRSYYSHESPEGSSVMERSRAAGYAANVIGENIAEGQGTVREVMQGWMDSPRHRDHILSLTFREIGMGVAFGRNDRGWEIVWVQVFGVPRADSSRVRRVR